MGTFYKAFDTGLVCRGFQYKVGEPTLVVKDLTMCSSGYHACPIPLQVLTYYPPDNGREYAVVRGEAEASQEDKVVCSTIVVESILNLEGLVNAQVAVLTNEAHAATSGYKAHAHVQSELSIASSLGIDSRAKGVLGSWIVLAEYVDGKVSIVRTAKIDGTNLQPDVWYGLENGEFIEKETNE